MSNNKKPTINVAMKTPVHEKAKALQEANKLATISDAIELALDTYNKKSK